MLSTPSSPANTGFTTKDLWKAAVNVGFWYPDKKGEQQFCSGGTGALIKSTGTVLTNDHVITLDDKEKADCPGAELWVGYALTPDAEYFAWWKATPQGRDPVLDAAILAVDLTTDPWLEDSLLDPSPIRSTTWPVLKVATTDEAPQLGDWIQLYSYPAIGGYSVTYTAGYVAGWTYDADTKASSGIMKVDLTAAHGSSGSAVLDVEGRVVGLMMIVGSARGGEIVDCMEAAGDTNGDGKYDDADGCLPVGGFLNGAIALEPLRQFLNKNGLLVP